ncbi:MAG: biotin--[acetyl-CoA-carboxylase] ligase [Prevotella sp.]|uniref:biotin--[acetyl-CoA-carboxylase] ligase n=1 Tax=Prevotella sp. TaxID=59823 RepID=UPI002A29CC4B|nr:biotin--[acetyl-CoA-carboxylase] ligase [Prevotella sp.]MDD7317189.1 biotin--[acetyl-CoA-carboxylase] ligase [Prevotellaceae bacterium]MDY4019792.1 biotin--[acetyl-CoA-carboxylase] ligase [Prevotella sp.]
MDCKVIYREEIGSTNNFLREYDGGEDMVVAWTDFQTAGRGQGINRWESERGKNLTFSILIHPKEVDAAGQYVLSMLAAVSISEYLADVLHRDIRVKWPNDIYVDDMKIAGILIESRLSGQHIKDCIIGIGLNVNQRVFESDAPNPVSMSLVDGRKHNREEVLQSLLRLFMRRLEHFDSEEIRRSYRNRLYRRSGMHRYRDAAGTFMAEIITVEDDGHIVLRDTENRERRYAFKEVAFVPEPKRDKQNRA